jgi:hypothetical protein
MRALLLSLVLVPALLADSAQEILDDMAKALANQRQAPGAARCELGKREIRPHRAHGKLPLGLIHHLIFGNSQVTFSLRYWMNIADQSAKVGTAIEGSTGLGMDRPNSVNWYNNNFFEFSYGGKQILKSAMAELAVAEAEGNRAMGTLTWDVPEARVVLELSLAADADHLDVLCRVEAKGDPQPVRLGFRAYPGHTQPPRARRVVTAKRELRPDQTYDLLPEETTLVLFDEAEPQLPCAIRFAEAKAQKTRLELGSYGVTIHLDYAPAKTLAAGPVQLWDFRDVSLNDVMDRLLAARSEP